MNLLYIGIRCNNEDIDGSAWNHHKKNLDYIFERLKYNVEYFNLGNLHKYRYSILNYLLIILKQTIIKKRLIPFQEIIYLLKFYNNNLIDNLIEIIERKKFDIIFFEGIRLTFILEELSSIYDLKDKLIVCDMDDLLSRRYFYIKKNNHQISFGYETKNLSFFSKFINNSLIKNIFLRYEISALQNSESKLKFLCNSISLVSKKEAQNLKKIKGINKSYISHTLSFDPYFDVKDSYSFSNIERFIFIGSDRQIQNQSSINNLLKIWMDESIKTNLFIYGKMFKSYFTKRNNIFFKGYVKDLSECYLKNSVLINLTEIDGGIKIKTIQAISRGIPVIGLHNAFDGLPLDIDLFKFKNISQVNSFLKSEQVNNYIIKQYEVQNKIAKKILSKESVFLNWESIFKNK